jgi:hypothetical protein
MAQQVETLKRIPETAFDDHLEPLSDDKGDITLITEDPDVPPKKKQRVDITVCT